MRSRTKKTLGAVIGIVPPTAVEKLGARTGNTWFAETYHKALLHAPRDYERSILDGVIFAGNTEDVIQRHIYIHGLWEPEITSWVGSHLKPGDGVIDVGANVGYFALLAASLVGADGYVVAIEPVGQNAAHVKKLLARNDVRNIDLHECVAAAEVGSSDIYIASGGNLGNSSTVEEAGHSFDRVVPAVPIDDIMSAYDVDKLKLIKIDTEGDEVRVLAGGIRTLSNVPPGCAVLVEVTPDKLQYRGQTERDVWSFFPEESWAAYEVRNDYELRSYIRHQTGALKTRSGPDGRRADLIFVKR